MEVMAEDNGPSERRSTSTAHSFIVDEAFQRERGRKELGPRSSSSSSRPPAAAPFKSPEWLLRLALSFIQADRFWMSW